MNQLALNFPTARNSDPETSHKGGQDIKIRSSSQQWLLLKAYVEKPFFGMTDEEAGLIQPTGEERPSTAGSMQQVCVITEAGKLALR